MTKKLWIDTVTKTQVQPVIFELLYFNEFNEYQVTHNGGEFALRFDADQFEETMRFMQETLSESRQK